MNIICGRLTLLRSISHAGSAIGCVRWDWELLLVFIGFTCSPHGVIGRISACFRWNDWCDLWVHVVPYVVKIFLWFFWMLLFHLSFVCVRSNWILPLFRCTSSPSSSESYSVYSIVLHLPTWKSKIYSLIQTLGSVWWCLWAQLSYVPGHHQT